MQNQAILAGLRALVEQIDHLERQTALRVSQQGAVSGRGSVAVQANALVNSGIQAATISDRVSISAPSLQPTRRAGTNAAQSRAAVIAQRLGVSNRNFFQVAHAVGRDGGYVI